MRKILTAVLLATCLLTACGGKHSSTTVTVVETVTGDGASEETLEIPGPGGEAGNSSGETAPAQNPAAPGESVGEIDGQSPALAEGTVIAVPADQEVKREGPKAADGQPDAIPGAPSDEEEETGDTAAETPVQQMADPASSGAMGVVIGEVIDASMNTVTVKSDVDGAEYLFLKSEAETDLADGLLLGNTVEILYEGVLNGTDTSGVRVLLVADNMEKTITGTVTAEAMSTIRIVAEDGRELSFSKEEAEVIRSQEGAGLEGRTVALTYTGEIFDLDTTYAYVWTIEETE